MTLNIKKVTGCLSCPPPVVYFLMKILEPQNGENELYFQISARLAEVGYYRIECLRMQGIVLSVFALKLHLPQIRDVRCDWIGTGHANFWGNKGAVAVR